MEDQEAEREASCGRGEKQTAGKAKSAKRTGTVGARSELANGEERRGEIESCEKQEA